MLLMIESFEGDDLAEKGWTGSTSTSNTGTARTGSRHWSSNNGALTWPLGADEHATVIVGFGTLTQGSGVSEGPTSDGLLLKGDGGTVTHLTIGTDATGKIEVRRGGTTVIATSAAPVITAANPGWHYVEVKATLHDTTGAVVVAVDGVEVINATGLDTKNGGTEAVFDAVTFVCNGTSTAFMARVDDVYICNGAGTSHNDLLGECRVRALYPSGDGTYSQFVGSDGDSVNNYALVDEASTASPSDYVGSGTVGHRDSYAITDLTETTASVFGVQVVATMSKSDTGVRTANIMVRSGGTDYDDTAATLNTGGVTMKKLYETDPATGVDWTRAGVSALEIGVKVAS